jgi:hypothetical protein
VRVKVCIITGCEGGFERIWAMEGGRMPLVSQLPDNVTDFQVLPKFFSGFGGVVPKAEAC